MGDAIALWVQDIPGRRGIWASRLDSALLAWGAAVSLDAGTGQVDDPDVAMDAMGNAIAVWQSEDTTSVNIWANRFH